MDRIAKKLTNYIIKKGMIGENERILYEYGFVLALESGLSLLICFGIACTINMAVEGILFFIIFIPLRSYAGGLHLEHCCSCLILSCLTFSIILLFAAYVECPLNLLVLLFGVMLLGVYVLYPVENINRRVEKVENDFFKKRLKLFLLLDFFLGSTCWIFKLEKYLMVITTTFFMVVITMFLGKYKYNRQNHSGNI